MEVNKAEFVAFAEKRFKTKVALDIDPSVDKGDTFLVKCKQDLYNVGFEGQELGIPIPQGHPMTLYVEKGGDWVLKSGGVCTEYFFS